MIALPITGELDRPTPVVTGLVTSALIALSVGLLVAGTLCTVAAVVIGASLHLVGLPGDWATGVAALVAIAGLVPSAALARRAWLVERHSIDL